MVRVSARKRRFCQSHAEMLQTFIARLLVEHIVILAAECFVDGKTRCFSATHPALVEAEALVKPES